MNKADTMVALAIMRQVDLQRVATGILNEMVEDLSEIKEEAALIAFRLDPADVTRVGAKRARVGRMQEEIDELIDRVMTELSKRAESDFSEIEQLLEEDNRNNFAFVYGLGLAFADLEKPTIQGLPVRDHFSRLADDLSFRMGLSIRDAWEGAGTAEEIARRIRLETEFGRSPVDQTARGVETTVRTGVDDIPSRVETRQTPVALPVEEVPPGVEPSPISPHGWQHVSVLDNRTTDTCRGRAWRIWDAQRQPVGHRLPFSQPPLHPYCRSRLVMVFLEDPPARQLTFTGFVGQMSRSQRVKLFGESNVRLWEKGLLTDAQLIRQQGRPMTIEELRKRVESKSDQKELGL